MTIESTTKHSTKQPFVVSAPGKVIIFGEHAAVFHRPAIAAALSLRTYLLSSPSSNPDDIVLEFPDIGFSHTWNRQELPWTLVNELKEAAKQEILLTPELIPEITSDLAPSLASITSTFHYNAAYAFLYLYVNLCSHAMPGMTYVVRSTLPIGAGLGSSASISVCLASALGVLGGHVKSASLDSNGLTVDNPDSTFIDNWSFMGEKCIHGNPSGIDNAVATHGGAVMFQRTKTPSPSVRTAMRNFPSLKLLLTNTLQPRSTAQLVAGVTKLVNEYPTIGAPILDAIEHLTKEGYNMMIRPSFTAEDRTRLRELIRINHGLLVSLGVSHPTLEKIKFIADQNQIGETKLTGAGGGGCAITLLKDDIDESIVEKVTKDFYAEGFETFETSLGGKGAGMLLPESEDFFTVENFLSFKNRDQIEAALGKQNWKFW